MYKNPMGMSFKVLGVYYELRMMRSAHICIYDTGNKPFFLLGMHCTTSILTQGIVKFAP